MNYRCSEIAEITGVSKRTIHYYISIGLLPPPDGIGAAAKYNDTHITKVRKIKALQKDYLPLSKIQDILNSEENSKEEGFCDTNTVVIGDILELRCLQKDKPDEDTLIKLNKIAQYAKTVLSSDTSV